VHEKIRNTIREGSPVCLILPDYCSIGFVERNIKGTFVVASENRKTVVVA